MSGLPELPSARTIASLMLGRLVYRVSLYAAGLALLAVWGPEQFALYATATGAAGWLFALTSSGPEKAALALVPRTGGAALETFFARLAVGPFLTLLLAAGVMSVVASAQVASYVLAAAAVTGVGTCAVLVSLHRMRGSPYTDLVSYLTISVGYLGAVAIAAVGADVFGVLVLLVAVVLGVDLVLVNRLARGGHAPRVEKAKPARAREAWRAASLLGAGEVLGMAASSLLFAYFAIADVDRQTSLFYVVMVVSSCFAVGLLYLLRLAQPRVSAQLERQGEEAGWRLAGRILGWTVAVGAPTTAAAVVVGLERGPSDVLAWATLVLEMALFGALACAVLLLETSGARGRSWSARAAVVEFAVVALAGWWWVGAAGAAGALAALCVGLVTKAGLLAGRGRAMGPSAAKARVSVPGEAAT